MVEVVTWNVQRMSLGGRWKRKAREVAKYASECKWDVVLLNEVRSEGRSVWMGEWYGWERRKRGW